MSSETVVVELESRLSRMLAEAEERRDETRGEVPRAVAVARVSTLGEVLREVAALASDSQGGEAEQHCDGSGWLPVTTVTREAGHGPHETADKALCPGCVNCQPEQGGEAGDWPELISEAKEALADFDSHGDYECPVESLRRIIQKLSAHVPVDSTPTQQPLSAEDRERLKEIASVLRVGQGTRAPSEFFLESAAFLRNLASAPPGQDRERLGEAAERFEAQVNSTLQQRAPRSLHLAEKCPMCEKPVDEAPNVLSAEEATAIVSAAFGEDHHVPSFTAAIKRLGDWVDAELKDEVDSSPPEPPVPGETGKQITLYRPAAYNGPEKRVGEWTTDQREVCHLGEEVQEAQFMRVSEHEAVLEAAVAEFERRRRLTQEDSEMHRVRGDDEAAQLARERQRVYGHAAKYLREKQAASPAQEEEEKR